MTDVNPAEKPSPPALTIDPNMHDLIEARASKLYRTLAAAFNADPTVHRTPMFGPIVVGNAYARVAELLHDGVITAVDIAPVLAGAKRLSSVLRELADQLTAEAPEDADEINDTIRWHAIVLEKWIP